MIFLGVSAATGTVDSEMLLTCLNTFSRKDRGMFECLRSFLRKDSESRVQLLLICPKGMVML